MSWVRDAQAHQVMPTTTTLSGFRTRSRHLLEPAAELDVINAIVLRESYLSRLRAMAESLASRLQSSRNPDRGLLFSGGLLDILDLLRIASLDVVEAISVWRLAHQHPFPLPVFLWNGSDYLEKMRHDTDFLDALQALRVWLDFSLLSNPFIVPHTNHGVSSNDIFSQSPPHAIDRAAGILAIGRHPWQGSIAVTDNSAAATAAAARLQQQQQRRAKSAAGSSRKHAYATPVINDASYLPVPRTAASAFPFGVDLNAAPEATTRLEIADMAPNMLSSMDWQRVQQAETVVFSRSSSTSGMELVSYNIYGGEGGGGEGQAIALQELTMTAAALSHSPLAAADAACGVAPCYDACAHVTALHREAAAKVTDFNSLMFQLAELDRVSAPGDWRAARRALAVGAVLPEDEEVAVEVERRAATLLQARARGIAARTYALWLHGHVHGAAARIQAGVRGYRSRRALAKARHLYAHAVPLQALARRFLARCAYVREGQRVLRETAVRRLQRVARGMLGRRRAGWRVRAVTANTTARGAVCALHPRTLRELGNALLAPVLDPSVPFPALEVLALKLLRLLRSTVSGAALPLAPEAVLQQAAANTTALSDGGSEAEGVRAMGGGASAAVAALCAWLSVHAEQDLLIAQRNAGGSTIFNFEFAGGDAPESSANAHEHLSNCEALLHERRGTLAEWRGERLPRQQALLLLSDDAATPYPAVTHLQLSAAAAAVAAAPPNVDAALQGPVTASNSAAADGPAAAEAEQSLSDAVAAAAQTMGVARAQCALVRAEKAALVADASSPERLRSGALFPEVAFAAVREAEATSGALMREAEQQLSDALKLQETRAGSRVSAQWQRLHGGDSQQSSAHSSAGSVSSALQQLEAPDDELACSEEERMFLEPALPASILTQRAADRRPTLLLGHFANGEYASPAHAAGRGGIAGGNGDAGAGTIRQHQSAAAACLHQLRAQPGWACGDDVHLIDDADRDSGLNEPQEGDSKPPASGVFTGAEYHRPDGDYSGDGAPGDAEDVWAQQAAQQLLLADTPAALAEALARTRGVPSALPANALALNSIWATIDEVLQRPQGAVRGTSSAPVVEQCVDEVLGEGSIAATFARWLWHASQAASALAFAGGAAEQLEHPAPHHRTPAAASAGNGNSSSAPSTEQLPSADIWDYQLLASDAEREHQRRAAISNCSQQLIDTSITVHTVSPHAQHGGNSCPHCSATPVTQDKRAQGTLHLHCCCEQLWALLSEALLEQHVVHGPVEVEVPRVPSSLLHKVMAPVGAAQQAAQQAVRMRATVSKVQQWFIIRAEACGNAGAAHAQVLLSCVHQAAMPALLAPNWLQLYNVVPTGELQAPHSPPSPKAHVKSPKAAEGQSSRKAHKHSEASVAAAAAAAPAAADWGAICGALLQCLSLDSPDATGASDLALRAHDSAAPQQSAQAPLLVTRHPLQHALLGNLQRRHGDDEHQVQVNICEGSRGELWCQLIGSALDQSKTSPLVVPRAQAEKLLPTDHPIRVCTRLSGPQVQELCKFVMNALVLTVGSTGAPALALRTGGSSSATSSPEGGPAALVTADVCSGVDGVASGGTSRLLAKGITTVNFNTSSESTAHATAPRKSQERGHDEGQERTQPALWHVYEHFTPGFSAQQLSRRFYMTAAPDCSTFTVGEPLLALGGSCDMRVSSSPIAANAELHKLVALACKKLALSPIASKQGASPAPVCYTIQLGTMQHVHDQAARHSGNEHATPSPSRGKSSQSAAAACGSRSRGPGAQSPQHIARLRALPVLLSTSTHLSGIAVRLRCHLEQVQSGRKRGFTLHFVADVPSQETKFALSVTEKELGLLAGVPGLEDLDILHSKDALVQLAKAVGARLRLHYCKTTADAACGSNDDRHAQGESVELKLVLPWS
ncbi:hypothetical protein JKP88DRAFT_255394 [Tribonema minus]|uniref:Uncharacterized protein n=1 Tax=Tribonema minus TaxID=303371 RepID=A0A835YZL0_9STRA|nr:hypothetical protein JKP88DRAFT_255394 [Tribonema minus]